MNIPEPITYTFPSENAYMALKEAIRQALQLPEAYFSSVHESQMTASLLFAIINRLHVPKQRMKIQYHELAVIVIALRNYVKTIGQREGLFYNSVIASKLLMDLEPELASMKQIEKSKGHALLHDPQS